jgi:hypothetical protein
MLFTWSDLANTDDFPHGSLTVLRAEISDNDIRARLSQRHRNRRPQSAATPGHYGHSTI